MQVRLESFPAKKHRFFCSMGNITHNKY